MIANVSPVFAESGSPRAFRRELAIVAWQSSVGLAWDANPASDNVTRYLVGHRTSTGSETLTIVGLTLTHTVTGLIPGQTYFFRVYAENANGRSGPSNEVSDTLPPPPDTSAPSAPATLTGTAASTSQINLSWSASSDNVAVTEYHVRRNEAPIASVPVTQTTYSDVGLSPATSYTYTVLAEDAAGNLSAESPVAIVTTLGDTTAPSIPTNLAGTVTPTTASLTWSASTDNLGVVGYRVSRTGAQPIVTNVTSHADSGLTPGTAYTWTVEALDDAGNLSPAASLTLTTPALPAPCVANGKPYSITIQVQGWTKVVAPGARGRVDVTLANSFPVTKLQVLLGTQVVAEIIGAELRDVAGLMFSVPNTAGPYSLFVAAVDATGCRTVTTLTRPLVVQ